MLTFLSRNLQQIHKIPGTTYASPQESPLSTGSATHVRGLATQGGDWDAEHASGQLEGGGEGDFEFSMSTTTTDGDANFKAKMEALHDPTSTNLYMEGWVFYFYFYFYLGGVLGFGVFCFCGLFSLGRFLWAVFFGSFSLGRFLCAVFFVLLSLCCFLWAVLFV